MVDLEGLILRPSGNEKVRSSRQKVLPDWIADVFWVMTSEIAFAISAVGTTVLLLRSGVLTKSVISLKHSPFVYKQGLISSRFQGRLKMVLRN